MWRYLKAAFLARPHVPGLGAVPLNLVAVAAVGILGFINPGIWFLGAGLELGYLWLLVSNQRFRNVVDALETAPRVAADATAREKALLDRLTAPARKALAKVEAGCARVLELQQSAHAESFVLEGNRDALARLRWTYLKLLVAEANLQSGEWDEPESSIRERITVLDSEIASAPTDGVRESKQATREILSRRLANRDQRLRNLAEIAADRARIEAQVELARENASIQGQPVTIASDVELASGLLDYGAAAPDIADLESAHAEARRRGGVGA
ncbi:MAG TPA: hypothetical protein DCS97_07295 [Planctomycetes bacterium]|nr:hypothetical protein [Planctomycetota bacterium]